MITEMVTVECYHAKKQETSDWLIRLAGYFNEHDLGQVVQVMHHISGPTTQFHLIINFASMAEAEQIRNKRSDDSGVRALMDERHEYVTNSTHHFLETTTFFER